MPVIGVLDFASADRTRTNLAALRQGLADAGIIEGREALIESRWANFQPPLLQVLAADLVSRKVAVIVATGTSGAVRAAKAATATIPIVFKVAIDPVAASLVASLNRPGGNVTGMTTLSLELAAKRLDLLREIAPEATTVAYLASSADERDPETRNILSAARQLGRQVIIMPVRSEHDIDTAFAMIGRREAGALIVSDFPTIYSQTDKIVELANLHKVPAIYPDATYAFRGGLMSYADNGPVTWRQVGAQYVGPILKGAKTVDLPVQQPTRLRLVINLRTARAFGLTVPNSLLVGADEVIE
jgi:putative ABC transport system substrate-binding protein